MIRVLEFIGDPLVYGGQEEFVLNMLNNFNNGNIQYTVCTPFYCENEKLIKIVNRRNEKLLTLNFNVKGELRKLRVAIALKRVLKENTFDVVHIHAGSTIVLYKCAKIAKKLGVKKVIVHSHMAGNLSFVAKTLKKYTDKHFDKYVDKYLACSRLAGECKFPIKVLNTDKFFVVNNGIDTEKFSFNENIRDQYRKEFKIENDLVLLNVGRFTEQKNQHFIVRFADWLKNSVPNFKIILVGDGKLKEQIIQNIKNLSLEEKFILLDKRNDVQNIMMASDIFVFPSTFEGLGIVTIEAQATGLPVIASEFIPEEAKITDLYHSVSLKNEDKWVELVKKIQAPADRVKYAEIIKKSGYSAKESALLLESLYIGDK